MPQLATPQNTSNNTSSLDTTPKIVKVFNNPNLLTQVQEKFTDDVVSDFFVFRFQIKEAFQTGEDYLKWILDTSAIQDDSTDSTITVDTIKEAKIFDLYFITKGRKRDTSIGGNDVINPYYQFNEDDDIVHPFHALDPEGTTGMGRVYAETYDQKQRILYLQFGVPQFCNLVQFYKEAVNSQLADLMNSGEESILKKIGRLIGTAAGTIITLPILPIIYLKQLTETLFYDKITKYYYFKPTMVLYYRIVNTILAYLAVSMHITDMDTDQPDEAAVKDLPEEGESSSVAQDNPATVAHTSTDGLVSVFRKYGCDIVSILARKELYDGLIDEHELPKLEKLIKAIQEGNKHLSWWERFTLGFKASASQSIWFLGFRVEKGTEASESATNTTRQPDIAQKVNNTISTIRSKMIDLAGGRLVGGYVGDIISAALGGVKNILEGALDSVGLSGVFSTLTGGGYIDFPEVWDNSSFDHSSYRFRMKFYALYGNIVSIFYDLYLPLALFLAGALPRATGKASYTSPFLVRAFCKGLFAVHMGIIDNITITRGQSEFGWNYDFMPIVLEVEFSIKDLCPIMYVPVAGNAFTSLLAQPSTFVEYMLTLAGSSIYERLFISERIKRRIKAMGEILKNNVFNLTMLGARLGDSPIMQTLYCIFARPKIPGSPTRPK